MLGSYVRADVPAAGPRGRLAETQPQRNPRAREVFSNAVRVYLAGTRLWILDGNSISCAADATGRILTQAQGSSGYAGDLVPLAAGRLALAWNGRILRVDPPMCTAADVLGWAGLDEPIWVIRVVVGAGLARRG